MSYRLPQQEWRRPNISDIEEWDTAAKEALTQAQENQEALQAKLTELEARSRRNNLRIYGVPEESEGSNLSEFVTKLIQSEVGLPVADMDLGIRCCHQALAPKPPQDAPPRSLVICFFEFRVKEQVLRTAWGKKDVCYEGKRIYFDQDYPPEILKKGICGDTERAKSQRHPFPNATSS